MAGSDLGEGIGCLFRAIMILLVAAALGAVYFVYSVYVPDKLESPYPITPTKQLIIKDNKVDTLYIYKLKNK